MANNVRLHARQMALPVRDWALFVGFLGVIVLALLGPWMVYSDLPMAGDGSPVRQAAYIAALGFTIFAVRPLNAPQRLLALPITVVVALAWCALTVTWAIEPSIAVRRLVLTVVIIWTIFLGVRELGYTRAMTILRVALFVTLIANYIAVFAFPDFGIHQFAEPGDKRLVGDWRGVLMHKNFAGAVSAVTILAFVFDARAIPRALRFPIILAAAIFLYFTASKTSYGLVLAALLCGVLFQYYDSRFRVPVIISLIVAGLVTAIAFALLRNPLNAQLEDANAFTGRTQIWKALARFLNDHGLLGAGFGSFWNIGPASPIYHYANNWVTTVASGHNGFMDLLITIGAPGVALAVIAVFIMPLFRLLTDHDMPRARGALLIAILLFCIGHNTTESSIFDRDTIVEVILMIAIAAIAVAPGPVRSMRELSGRSSQRRRLRRE